MLCQSKIFLILVFLNISTIGHIHGMEWQQFLTFKEPQKEKAKISKEFWLENNSNLPLFFLYENRTGLIFCETVPDHKRVKIDIDVNNIERCVILQSDYKIISIKNHILNLLPAPIYTENVIEFNGIDQELIVGAQPKKDLEHIILPDKKQMHQIPSEYPNIWVENGPASFEDIILRVVSGLILLKSEYIEINKGHRKDVGNKSDIRTISLIINNKEYQIYPDTHEPLAKTATDKDDIVIFVFTGRRPMTKTILGRPFSSMPKIILGQPSSAHRATPTVTPNFWAILTRQNKDEIQKEFEEHEKYIIKPSIVMEDLLKPMVKKSITFELPYQPLQETELLPSGEEEIGISRSKPITTSEQTLTPSTEKETTTEPIQIITPTKPEEKILPKLEQPSEELIHPVIIETESKKPIEPAAQEKPIISESTQPITPETPTIPPSPEPETVIIEQEPSKPTEIEKIAEEKIAEEKQSSILPEEKPTIQELKSAETEEKVQQQIESLIEPRSTIPAVPVATTEVEPTTIIPQPTTSSAQSQKTLTELKKETETTPLTTSKANVSTKKDKPNAIVKVWNDFLSWFNQTSIGKWLNR